MTDDYAASDIHVNTWTIEGATPKDAEWLTEAVAHNGGRVAVENGQVVIDETAVGLLRQLDADTEDGAIEDTPDGLVMYAAGDAYPLRPADRRGMHFHET